MRKFLSAAAVILCMGMAACTTAGPDGTPAAWSAAQTAHVELVTYQAAQTAAIAAAQAPGLSAKDVTEIQVGEDTATAALTAQAQALGQGGDLQAQLVDAIASAAGGAVQQIAKVIAAKHGGDGVDAKEVALAGGVGALSQAPAVIAAIERVRGGWQPTAADLAEDVAAVQRLHQTLLHLGQPQGA